MIIDIGAVEDTSNLKTLILILSIIYLFIFLLVNSKYFIKNHLIKKEILINDTTFITKKFNIIYSVVALSVNLAVFLLFLIIPSISLLNMFVLLLESLIAFQVFYAILRGIFELSNKIVM